MNHYPTILYRKGAIRHEKCLLFCEFNLDTACVELKYSDGAMIAINTIVIENEIVHNIYQQSEFDYLIHNAPLKFTDLILGGDPEKYLKEETQYKHLKLNLKDHPDNE